MMGMARSRKLSYFEGVPSCYEIRCKEYEKLLPERQRKIFGNNYCSDEKHCRNSY